MTSLIDRGFALLNRAMTPAASTTVQYTRGATVISEALPAVLSAPEVVVLTDGGMSVIGREFKWRLSRSDLWADGVETTPQRNDRIEWTHDGKTYSFQVLPESGGTESATVDPRSDWIPAGVMLIGISGG